MQELNPNLLQQWSETIADIPIVTNKWKLCLRIAGRNYRRLSAILITNVNRASTSTNVNCYSYVYFSIYFKHVMLTNIKAHFRRSVTCLQEELNKELHHDEHIKSELPKNLLVCKTGFRHCSLTDHYKKGVVFVHWHEINMYLHNTPLRLSTWQEVPSQQALSKKFSGRFLKETYARKLEIPSMRGVRPSKKRIKYKFVRLISSLG